MAQFRHEWKYEINYSDLLAIRRRLSAVAQVDQYAIDGTYEIRSLYFDNLEDKILREKQDGIGVREKYRIRYYSGNTQAIRLEKKSKRGSLGTKYGAPLSRGEVQAILDGQYAWMAESGRPLVVELYSKILTQSLRPKTIVEYTRQPFTYAPGNVRVTLDYNLRMGLGYSGFLDPDCVTIPARDRPVILEIKWDAYLPTVIEHAVRLPGRASTPFSKYAVCRVYG
ncbi:polyphosphate polymerase domain-containing protein [Pseudoflavonifractor sp. 524-17]|nr:polyphosphate polymerase domain-containing protein [Pseudoflavonifractor sp. 524-17]